MKTQHEILNRAYEILRETASKCPTYHNRLLTMTVSVSSRMTRAAGRATYARNEIELSLPFFASEENFEKGLFNTVTHEAAHLIVGVENRNGRPHGTLWKLVHRSLGGTGERCHNFALADGFTAKRRAARIDGLCSKCNGPIKLGPTQAKRHQANIKAGLPGYRHKICPTA